MKTFDVTQTAYFTWRVEAETPEEAEALAADLGYDDAYYSGAEPVDLNDIVEVAEEDL